LISVDLIKLNAFYLHNYFQGTKMDKVCGTCQFAHMEVDNHDDVSIECRKYPPTIINSGSLAKFPKILPKWHCGEYSEGDKNYWDLLP
jgi:hypothetical protein